jgi:hypothetical protein
MRLDHVASVIVNANNSVNQRPGGRVADRIRFCIPQATEWQRTGDQIDGAFNLLDC